jgi:homoserine dehydrogenase
LTTAHAKRPVRVLNLCFLGYGNVNRTLIDLLASKSAELREFHGIEYRITGIASRRLGWIADTAGIALAGAVSPNATAYGQSNVRDWLRAANADVLFEATSLNVADGQPAIDHLRAALELGAHAITANKGPVVFACNELQALAAQQKKQFLFESTVMDGVPIFALFRQALPVIHIKSFRGILNSTTNVILTGMEDGLSFEQSLKKAQQIGVAETDSSADIEGWDATVKVTALVNVLMSVRLRPTDVHRQGIQNLSPEAVRKARASGQPYKLVCQAHRTESGVVATVAPEQLPLTDPLALVAGTSSIIQFETDIFPKLTITEDNPGLYATAYGMLADFVRAVSE